MSRSAANKKQDEKNLRTLRELAAAGSNRQCFDCFQRGPTYVNMTIGSFVCTSCSGRLRGLNPPHRVKSMSMATFTQDEIEFIKSRGNEHCRRTWMGRHDKSRAMDESSFKDETQMKDFLTLKYEKKRWYLSPSEIGEQVTAASLPPGSIDGSRSNPSVNNGHEPAVAAERQPSASSPRPGQKNANLVSLLDTDPFSSHTNAVGSAPAAPFANFANFDAFSSTNDQIALNSNHQQDHTGGQMSKSATIPSMTVKPLTTPQLTGGAADKYSALKELDELFSQPLPSASGPQRAPWPAPTTTGSNGNPFYATSTQPLAAWLPGQPQHSVTVAFAGAAIPPTPSAFGANPFFSAPGGANPFGAGSTRFPTGQGPQLRPSTQDPQPATSWSGVTPASSNPFSQPRSMWNPFMN